MFDFIFAIFRTVLGIFHDIPGFLFNFLTSCKPVSCSRRTLHRGV